MYAIRSYYVNIGNPGSGQRGTMEVLMQKMGVITSYSIHYTKLYEVCPKDIACPVSPIGSSMAPLIEDHA